MMKTLSAETGAPAGVPLMTAAVYERYGPPDVVS
jgi:hypothetical protein